MSGHNSVLFDTSIATENIGDEIIIDSVRQELQKCVNDHFFVRLPTHDNIGKIGRKWVEQADICIVGGTNLLSSQYWNYSQWKITPLDAYYLRGKVILMGVGWWQYQSKPDPLTRLLYRMILAQTEGVYHSVRDEYTRNMLESIGISNVLNTSCPTMWRLGAEHCSKIPAIRGDNVVMTLTDYNKNAELDRALFLELTARYSKVIAWPQGVGDRDYLIKLGVSNIIDPGLWSLDQALSNPNTDYVGTRLHAGVRALQHGRRTLILAVDNRAKEIAKDTGLWVVDRMNLKTLCSALDEHKRIDINLPSDSIQKWKESISRISHRKSY